MGNAGAVLSNDQQPPTSGDVNSPSNLKMASMNLYSSDHSQAQPQNTQVVTTSPQSGPPSIPARLPITSILQNKAGATGRFSNIC